MVVVGLWRARGTRRGGDCPGQACGVRPRLQLRDGPRTGLRGGHAIYCGAWLRSGRGISTLVGSRGGDRRPGGGVEGRVAAFGEGGVGGSLAGISELLRGCRGTGGRSSGLLRAAGAAGAGGVSTILLLSGEEEAGEEVWGPPHPERLGAYERSWGCYGRAGHQDCQGGSGDSL